MLRLFFILLNLVVLTITGLGIVFLAYAMILEGHVFFGMLFGSAGIALLYWGGEALLTYFISTLN